MGTVLSHVRQYARKVLVQAVLRALALVSSPIYRLVTRLALSPGIPVPDPCESYWTSPPSPIAKHGSGPDTPIPDYADIVIIGSGITGTSVARTILDHDAHHHGASKPLKVVMLEARDACSGATGRNGGHITPVLYQDYPALKEHHGPEIAAQIIRFRLSHLTELLTVASEENLLDDCQCRETQSYDVYQDTGLYRSAKQLLEIYKRDLPLEGSEIEVIENKDALADLQLVPSVAGCVVTRGGAVHPYRLVTGILSRLLRCYRSSFHLYTHTPCTDIVGPRSGNALYTICTPRGNIRARHVIHATNAWASHLLPGMRSKIIPARGVMTAQHGRPGLGESKTDWRGMRSFVLYPSSSFSCFDYLTQQLPGAGESAGYPASSGELMLGGGFLRQNAHLTEIGNADDGDWNHKVGEYLSNAMGDYFRVGESDEKERVIGSWGGILAMSTDERPWVGRVPESVSRRGGVLNKDSFEETPVDGKGSVRLAPAGEWVAAGYSGEGMVHAWLSGRAVGLMVAGEEPGGWFPAVYRITAGRCSGAGVEGMLGAWCLGR